MVLPLTCFTYHVLFSLFRLSTYEITKPREFAFISNTVILSTMLFFLCGPSSNSSSSEERLEENDWRLQVT